MAWMAFMRVSTSVPKFTSLLPAVGVVVAIVLVLADGNVGELTGAFQCGSDLIGGLWL